MKKKFSTAWKSSKKPSKQVKYRAHAPLHIKRKFLSARLSKELTTKHNIRSLPLRTGDKVKIVRGTYKGKIGKIDHVSVKKERVFIDGTERIKTDGTKSFYPIHPSNVIIQEASTEDKYRRKSIERKGAKKA